MKISTKISVCALCCLLGFFGNWVKLTLFFNVDFLFGSFFTMLAIMALGGTYGAIVGIVTGTSTYILWNHPWAIIIFAAEAIFVAGLYSKRKGNLIIYDILYWACLGIPMIYLFYHHIMGMQLQSTLVIMLKQSINALLNALPASIALILFHLVRRAPGIRMAYSQVLFVVLVALVLLPSTGLMVSGTRTYEQKRKQSLEARVSSTSEAARKILVDWIEEHHRNVQILSTLVGNPNANTHKDMQHYVEIVKIASPAFKGMGVFNKSSITVAYDPLEEDEKPTLGVDFSYRPHVAIMQREKKPYITDVLISKLGNPSPIVIFLSPIIISEEYEGYCSGVVEVDQVLNLIRNLAGQGIDISVADGRNRVIVSTIPGLHTMDLFPRPYGEIVEMGDSLTRLWKPDPKPNTSYMLQWRNSYYFRLEPLSDISSWRVIVEASCHPLIEDISRYSLSRLGLLGLLILFAVVFSHFLSNGFISSVVKLQALTRSLPARLGEAMNIRWPESRIAELDNLSKDFRRMVTTLLEDITERKRAEDKFRVLFEASSDGILIADLETKQFKYANPAVCRFLGYSATELERLKVSDIHPKEELPTIIANFEEQARGEKELIPDISCLRRDGSVVYADVNAAPIMVDGRACLAGFFRDITERKLAEQQQNNLQTQLIQAQKMESVGRLAGGVAHDYNNILSIILGYTEMALDRDDLDEGLRNDLKEIFSSAVRSREITRQLLAFARKQTIDPKVLDLNVTIESMLRILRRLIGEDIDLAWLPGKALWPVSMDPSQIDQILANLCVNARDAISDVGKITIKTDIATIDQEYCKDHEGASQGDFVVLSVSDDGCGMDRDILGQIFEPFFTTKGVGKGTGLGLATVYGIVRQNNGFINVYSEPGEGTTFRIYLPRYAGVVKEDSMEIKRATAPGRGERLLVVEDDSSILKMAERILSGLNYKVLTANTPGEALHLAQVYNAEIDLLITDVVMPGMNGRELAEQLQATLFPNLKCLYMSGYTADVIAHRGILDKGFRFLQKPFSTRDLAEKVRAALDAI